MTMPNDLPGVPHRVDDVPMRPADYMFPTNRREAIAERKCIEPPIGCGNPIEGFKDQLSAKEFAVSGMCQQCQDGFFDSFPDEDEEEQEMTEIPYTNFGRPLIAIYNDCECDGRRCFWDDHPPIPFQMGDPTTNLPKAKPWRRKDDSNHE